MSTISLHLEIAAPDGSSALQLEQRLAHLSPTSVAYEGCWRVEIDAGADALDEIEGAVGGWLRDIGEAATTMRLDGRTIPIWAHPTVGNGRSAPRQVTFYREFIS